MPLTLAHKRSGVRGSSGTRRKPQVAKLLPHPDAKHSSVPRAASPATAKPRCAARQHARSRVRPSVRAPALPATTPAPKTRLLAPAPRTPTEASAAGDHHRSHPPSRRQPHILTMPRGRPGAERAPATRRREPSPAPSGTRHRAAPTHPRALLLLSECKRNRTTDFSQTRSLMAISDGKRDHCRPPALPPGLVRVCATAARTGAPGRPQNRPGGRGRRWAPRTRTTRISAHSPFLLTPTASRGLEQTISRGSFPPLPVCGSVTLYLSPDVPTGIEIPAPSSLPAAEVGIGSSQGRSISWDCVSCCGFARCCGVLGICNIPRAGQGLSSRMGIFFSLLL